MANKFGVQLEFLEKHTEPIKECSICGYKFHTNYKLTLHMQKHTKEKPFSCTYCSVAYTQKNDSVKQLRSHISENTYSCRLCNAAFHYRVELKEHQYNCTADQLIEN